MWLTNLLWQNKTAIGLGLIALVAGLYIGALKVEISSLNNKLEATNAELAQTAVSLSMEKAKTARLVAALETVSAEGKRKQESAAMWRKKYESSVQQYQKLAGGLISWTPNPSEGDCDAAKRLLRDYRK
jgi:uncharacterized membrane-anchored protein YhcB (DUF1043 family)